MRAGRAFFDTNIFLYTVDRVYARKRGISQDLITEFERQGSGVISYQVVQELVHNLRRGSSPQLDVAACASYCGYLWSHFEVVQSSRDLTMQALNLHERNRVSWYDALIVAAAQVGNCEVLYSEDLQAGQQFGAVRVVNPFR